MISLIAIMPHAPPQTQMLMMASVPASKIDYSRDMASLARYRVLSCATLEYFSGNLSVAHTPHIWSSIQHLNFWMFLDLHLSQDLHLIIPHPPSASRRSVVCVPRRLQTFLDRTSSCMPSVCSPRKLFVAHVSRAYVIKASFTVTCGAFYLAILAMSANLLFVFRDRYHVVAYDASCPFHDLEFSLTANRTGFRRMFSHLKNLSSLPLAKSGSSLHSAHNFTVVVSPS